VHRSLRFAAGLPVRSGGAAWGERQHALSNAGWADAIVQHRLASQPSSRNPDPPFAPCTHRVARSCQRVHETFLSVSCSRFQAARGMIQVIHRKGKWPTPGPRRCSGSPETRRLCSHGRSPHHRTAGPPQDGALVHQSPKGKRWLHRPQRDRWIRAAHPVGIRGARSSLSPDAPGSEGGRDARRPAAIS
jgi:hypothetical protein